MPTPAYMTITGAEQGNITTGALTPESVGTSSIDAHQDEIIVLEFDHEVFIPTRLDDGGPVGQRVHKALHILKPVDKTTPLLYQALTGGEALTVEIKWPRPKPNGAGLEHYFTHTLEKAYITKMKTVIPNCLDPTKAALTHLEEVEFRYHKITWKHEVASTTATDSFG